MTAIEGAEDRLLTFEVAGALYALPIASVLEVAELAQTACIPTLPTRIGGVINYHGDALPVVSCSSLLELDDAALGEPRNILVIAGPDGESARLGVPIDRVLGLVDGAAPSRPGAKPVAELRSIDGRVASVLDPRRLLSQARSAIESSLGRRD
ncbi:MAG TPA: chemotaxis protein CheW [Myxococcota bacterium]|nr:chemotaxis protein CheW [Myxococcota bacterium]